MKLSEELEKNREQQKELYTNAFSKNLRNALEDSTKYKSARQLAEAANITPVMLSAFMTGAKLPTLVTAIQLADALGVSLDDLLGRHDNFKTIPAVSSLELLARNLIAMEDADVIDIRAPKNEGESFTLRFINGQIKDFFDNYYFLTQKIRNEGPIGKKHFDEWLSGEFEKLSKESVDMKGNK